MHFVLFLSHRVYFQLFGQSLPVLKPHPLKCFFVIVAQLLQVVFGFYHLN